MTAADTVRDLHVQVKRCPECGTGFGLDARFCPFDGISLATSTWDPTSDPLTNAVVDHRYEVIEPLGEGGMGTVYRVRHVTLDRMFAMKVLRRDLAADEGLAARFMQEARATAAIHHPSVVAITDFGELDDGAPYFVMELLVGETLSTRMRARRLLPPREAAGIAIKLAEALGAAHAANVVHRDLKPENVFLVGATSGKAATDELRIVDFGAAKVVGASKLTRPGVVFGTPYYMSPEQASGQPVDARADIYSLGVLLYEMLSGVLPFEADTYMGVLTKHMFATAAKPSERIPSGADLGALDAVVMRALEKEPAARFPSMAELAEAIERAVKAPRSVIPPAKSRSEPPFREPQLSTADRIQLSVSRRVVEEARRKQRAVALGVVAGIATIALGVLAVSFVDRDRGRRAGEEMSPLPVTSTTGFRAVSNGAAPTSTTTASTSASPSVIAEPLPPVVSPAGSVPPASPSAASASPVLASPVTAAGRPVATAPALTAPLPAPAPRPRRPAGEAPTAARPASPPDPFSAPRRRDDFADPWSH